MVGLVVVRYQKCSDRGPQGCTGVQTHQQWERLAVEGLAPRAQQLGKQAPATAPAQHGPSNRACSARPRRILVALKESLVPAQMNGGNHCH
ncbi:hypothetical protein NDU88_004622 [Pleurodeles waltl]|uniref:Uncharacterized protein n=1 Tax=Pleurodeles waltl TaxID=8319 RepID=A0AAV7SJG7_PLEWA|nr:hypothetical protein NDU88_004622 [Pleurodeles waltl]